MTSIIKKIKKGRPYYYLVEMARVDGKPKRTWQFYLGSAEKIKENYMHTNGTNVHSMLFGSITSMLSIAEELHLSEIIQRAVPRINLKLSVPQHIIMQSICRFHEPASKAGSIKWYNESILPILWGKTFSSPQTILNQFDKMVNAKKNVLPEIEEEICKVLLEKGIKPSLLIWDPTNFFTYIKKGGELPKKGVSKEKRYDKNITNIGLVVSEQNIPLMHTTYEGNKHESTVITDIVDNLYNRLRKLGQDTKNMVFVFDRGNNSITNIPLIKNRFNFIGALKRNQLKHLLDIKLTEFSDLYTNRKGNVIKGYRTLEKVYGAEYTIVVTYNERTAHKQRIKTEESIKRITKEFNELENSINNPHRGKKATMKGVAQHITDFLHKQHRILFLWDFDEKEHKFSWSLNAAALKEREKIYGKNILFTDLEDWKTEDIAKTYNSKSIVEDDFKALKNRLLIPIKPFFHRDDFHLRVHIFICVLSMILYRYMLWKLRDIKLSDGNITKMIRDIRLAFIKGTNSNSVEKVLEHMTPEQIKIYTTLNLERYMLN
ncbi:IS1634 family transposase [Candidatus Marsarchaeota archaeon]|nr:IS1634 family transposase [Candidatus Marsarchaeota archaeon]